MMSQSLRLGLLLFSLAACTSERAGSPSSTKNEPPKRGPESPAAPVSREEVISPREDDRPVNAADYVARESVFRLFGTQAGDGTRGRGATLADTRDWSTKTYYQGDLIGRGMRVARIDDARVTMETAAGDTVLEVNADTKLRIVVHRFDIIAEPVGRNFYMVDTEAARAADGRLPLYEKAELYGGPVLKLGLVAEGTLFYGSDFREGDLVAAVDGRAADSGSLRAIATGLTDGRPEMIVRVIRNGAPADRTYRVKR